MNMLSLLAECLGLKQDPELLLTNSECSFSIHRLVLPDSKEQVILTNGLSNYLQPVSESAKDFERIELYFLLPDYWDLTAFNWPVSWLNRIAQVPSKNQTWFGPGDTLPAGNPPQPLADNFTANHFILSDPIALTGLEKALCVGETKIKFLAVIPIYQKEFESKVQNGARYFFKALEEKGYSEQVDTFRPPVIRKKFMGIF